MNTNQEKIARIAMTAKIAKIAKFPRVHSRYSRPKDFTLFRRVLLWLHRGTG